MTTAVGAPENSNHHHLVTCLPNLRPASLLWSPHDAVLTANPMPIGARPLFSVACCPVLLQGISPPVCRTLLAG